MKKSIKNSNTSTTYFTRELKENNSRKIIRKIEQTDCRKNRSQRISGIPRKLLTGHKEEM
jgi:hypothetical protein